MGNRDNDGWNERGGRGGRDREGGPATNDRDRHVDRGMGGYAAGGRDWSSNEGRAPYGDREDPRYDRYRTSAGAPSGGGGGPMGGGSRTGPFAAYDEGYGIYGAEGRGNAEDDPAWPWSAATGERYDERERLGRYPQNAFPPPGYGRTHGQGWAPSTYERNPRDEWSAGPYVDPTRRSRGPLPSTRTGRGPKGYTRSDERIREDIVERIIDNGLDASELELDAKDGEVFLSGAVHQRMYKHRIEDIAASVAGVREVHNRIRVKPLPESIVEREVEVMNPDAPPTPTMNVRRAAVESTHKS